MGHAARWRHSDPHWRDGPRRPLNAGGGADIRGRRGALLADRSLTGSGFCRAHTDLVESWLVDLLGDAQGVCLIAVGGMGRRELCPYSDVDLVLLHSGRKDVGDVAERLWYPIWDSGLSLDHSVRTPKQVLSVADDDLKAALGLLDGRPIAGDTTLADDVLDKSRQQWRRRAKRALPQLLEAVDERQQRFGEVAFLLEPDLKEGRGGLRDVQARRAAALAAPVGDPATEGAVLVGPNEVLLAARVELHRRAGKAADRLLLQEQDAVAAALGYSDADALMRAVSSAARTIAFEGDATWRRVRSWLAGPKGRGAGGDRPLGPGLAQREGEVVLAPDADPAGDRSLILRAAAASASAGAPLSASALDRLASSAAPPGDPWPDEARHALVALLGSGAAFVPVFETLDQRGLVARVLPEWTAVRSRPQRNAYHRFTVDRHLCETAVEASALTRQVSRPDLLLVAAWLHDLGKGYPGDHTVAGVALMGRIAARMGFDGADVEVLVKLVRYHLLLADTATRRDLSDQATIAPVAESVGDTTTLELLAALTEADSKATGSTAWGPWKAELVHELVARTSAFLDEDGDREPEREIARDPLVARARASLDAGARVHVEASWPELIVAARDRAGLFANVAGTLSLHGLSVLAADVWTSDDGVAVESFRTESTFGREPDRAALEADLAAAVDGRLPLEARLAERVRTYASRRTTATRRAAPRVLVDNEASARATLIEVRAPDGIAVLYRITRALAEVGLDVRYAKVATLGAEVVDAFYVVTSDGGKADVSRRQEVQRAVLTALGGPA